MMEPASHEHVRFFKGGETLLYRKAAALLDAGDVMKAWKTLLLV